MVSLRFTRILASCALATACTPQYDPCFALDSEVRSLQILAVRTDPPEAVLGADGAVPPVTVRALVVDPSAVYGTQFDVAATSCVPTDDRRCTSELVPETRGAIGELHFDVAPTAQQVQEALASDPLRGYGGIRVQLNLQVSGNKQQTTGEKVLLYAPAGAEPNHGLEIVGVRVRRFAFTFHEDRNVPLPPAEQVLAPGDPLLVDVGDPVWLEPILGPGPGATEAQELYDVTDLNGHRATLREQVSYSFYATPHSQLDPAHSSEPDPSVERPREGLTRYRYLRVHGGNAMVYVVARDSRGAQAWMQIPVQATDLRACAQNVPPQCPLLEFGCL